MREGRRMRIGVILINEWWKVGERVLRDGRVGKVNGRMGVWVGCVGGPHFN